MNQEQLRTELKKLIDSKETSCNGAARGMGISASALSTWLAGKYAGNVQTVTAAVAGYLKRMQEKRAQPKQNVGFVMTSVSAKIFEVARMCHLDSDIGVCYGQAGVGKTRSLKEYAAQNQDVILIEADLGYSAKALFQELHRHLGLSGEGQINSLKDQAIDKLKKSGRLIIVDEAEHLPYRALELLRRLNDKAEVGILMVGMPRFIANLRGKKGEYAQLYSRVGVSCKLEELKDKDSEDIVRSVPGMKYHPAYHEVSGGNARMLTKLMRQVPRVCARTKVDVSAEVIRETAKMLIV
ncbi:MAG: AAA family ATPase [Candidatus Edwardsbacteria bacterium]|nr:AAA family ATPase [Candidatus Edwardsbacteria bacterium]